MFHGLYQSPTVQAFVAEKHALVYAAFVLLVITGAVSLAEIYYFRRRREVAAAAAVASLEAQAGKPDKRRPLMSATAFERPIVARLPLST